MRDMFSNVAKLLKPSAPYALIVGHNRTSLGGKEFFIDTPNLLAELALSVGWSVDEIIPLDTYKRYGINSKNAINKESLILLRNIK
jgi:site-specific DNA-methyltransferase (cytosine-N4-specific)